MKVVAHWFHPAHGHVAGQMGIGTKYPGFFGAPYWRIKMDNLPSGVHPGIGSPAGVHPNGFIGHLGQRSL